MDNKSIIKIIGVGGAGCNAVDHMVEESIDSVEFYGLNTDIQALDKTNITNKLQIGKNLTKGLGAGADPEIGKASAEEDKEAIDHILENTNMVFITAGMGGGTGTGAAPVCAKYAKEKGILTIGVVTKPFDFENRGNVALEGIEELKKNVDSLIVIPNQNLLSTFESGVSMIDAFSKSNEVLLRAVQGISELLTSSGVVNVDFADVKKVMGNSGISMMGLGVANGEDKVQKATMEAINSQLLENGSIKGSKSLLVNVSGGVDLPLSDYNEIGRIIKENADPNAVIISGMSINHELNDNISVTVVATRLDESESNKEETLSITDSFENLRSRSSNCLKNNNESENKELINPESIAKKEATKNAKPIPDFLKFDDDF